MALRYAVTNGNWNDPTIWDNGQVPNSTDKVYCNAFNVTINQENLVIRSLSSDYPQRRLPDSAIPVLTIVTSSVSSSGIYNSTYEPWKAFTGYSSVDQWRASTTGTGWISYDFNTTRVIRQYYIRKYNSPYGPRSWNFEGSNDFNTWDILHTISGNTPSTYYSGDIGNTTAYRYYRLNVTATGGVQYSPWIYNLDMTESTGSVLGDSITGTFQITGSIDLIFSGKGFETFNQTCTVISATNPDIVNISTTGSGTILNGNQQYNNGDPALINITGNGTVNFTGDLYGVRTNRGGGIISYSRTGQIYINSSGTVNIIGNIYGSDNSNETYESPVVRLVGTGAILNITGNVYGSTTVQNHNTIWARNNQGTINITGNLISYLGSCIHNTSATTINHTGTAQASNNPGYPAIVSLNSSADVNLSTPFINYQGTSAIACFKTKFNSGSAVEWQVQDTIDTNFNIYSSNVTGSTLGLPLTTNVRSGITFGPDNDLTGTLVIPSANDVRKGVTVDNTVGTAELTAEDFLTAISSSANPVATRLKNVATVQTVGEHFNVFNP